MESYTIGEIAKVSNVSVETIRYYQKYGLIDESKRSNSGYRIFTKAVIERIKFIRNTQTLGFTLKEIKQLLKIVDGQSSHITDEIYNFTINKLNEIESKIRELNAIKDILENVSKRCPAKGTPDCCPIIQEFSQGGE